MRKVFSILLLLVGANGFSQATLKELVEWQERPVQEIKQHFRDAKWSLINESFSEQNKAGQINFSSTQRPDKTTVNLDIFYESSIDSQNRLFLRTKNKEWFEAVKAELTGLGFAFVSRQVVSGVATAIYTDKQTIVEILTERPVGVAPAYFRVAIRSNSYTDPTHYNFKKE